MNAFLVLIAGWFSVGFQGFVISDWQGIDRITSPPGSNYTYSVLASIQAGIDMVGFFVLTVVLKIYRSC